MAATRYFLHGDLVPWSPGTCYCALCDGFASVDHVTGEHLGDVAWLRRSHREHYLHREPRGAHVRPRNAPNAILGNRTPR